jgi:hypothetical protein
MTANLLIQMSRKIRPVHDVLSIILYWRNAILPIEPYAAKKHSIMLSRVTCATPSLGQQLEPVHRMACAAAGRFADRGGAAHIPAAGDSVPTSRRRAAWRRLGGCGRPDQCRPGGPPCADWKTEDCGLKSADNVDVAGCVPRPLLHAYGCKSVASCGTTFFSQAAQI